VFLVLTEKNSEADVDSYRSVQRLCSRYDGGPRPDRSVKALGFHARIRSESLEPVVGKGSRLDGWQ
jgi:hypothetical protein